MKRITTSLLISGLALFAALPAQARHAPEHGIAHVNERQDRQQHRIRKGIRSGDLTRWEARKLKKQQRRIEYRVQDFLEDGRLSHKERHILKRKQDKASQRIREFKHNDAYRYAKHKHHHDYKGDWEDRRKEVVRMLNGEDWPRYSYYQ